MSHSLCRADFQNLFFNFLNTLIEMVDKADLNEMLECEHYDELIKISDNKGNVYIISKHEPSMQIWIASPISGSVRFSYDQFLNTWLSPKNDELFNFLRSEMKIIFDIVI